MIRIAKNIGSVGLLFSITKTTGVAAIETGLQAESMATVDAQIKSLTSSVQQALSQAGEGSEALADSEIESMIQSHVEGLVSEQAQTELKTAHKHKKHHHHKKGKKHHKKHAKPQPEAFVQAKTEVTPTVPHANAPASSNLVKT